MDPNFIIVLFKNKVKKKIINKFRTQKRASNFYKDLLEKSNNVIFEKTFENGIPSEYDLALVSKKNGKTENVFVKDSLGRQKKVELEDDEYRILKISTYRIPDKILDLSNNKKITCEEFIKKYLPKNNISMISSLNNKIVVQNDDKLNLFTLKTVSDSSNFIDSLSKYFLSENRNDCIFVKDVSTAQRKYLYELLVEKGYSKSYLQRHSTTHQIKI